ncbi:short-chain dehydrogenase/reductase family 16C member 6 isoform X2 [Cephus cinctus]|uniref:Short-chain dehydrogenase/reductase family 16C member 6 isoform X2 n=1 Tax=Cephus cinctus TaxID=211228 RepID=A0AAJ7BK72_CEPCN|nr:short-chain dehydrogenase/reductase family 16C member 6 isoform X2 [Cephus cinctus]
MIPLKEESLMFYSKNDNFTTIAWLYLYTQFIVGAVISGFLAFLAVLKSILPKPPRDLTGDIALITGATTLLGSSLAKEFSRAGCSVVCIDKDLKSVKRTVSCLENCSRVERIGSVHRKRQDSERMQKSFAYECDFNDRDEIRGIAKKINDEVGQVDILVTCFGSQDEDILDTTVLAFLPFLLLRRKAHVIGVTPTISVQDAYMGSRAAVTGLMESLGQEFARQRSQLKFITVAPKAEPRLLKKTEYEIARNVVEAVRTDQSSLSVNWCSRMLYRISCVIYRAINIITQ